MLSMVLVGADFFYIFRLRMHTQTQIHRHTRLFDETLYGKDFRHAAETLTLILTDARMKFVQSHLGIILCVVS